MTVRNIATWVSVTDEDIVDFGIGDEATQAAARARLAREEERRAAYWRSLPARVRIARTLRSHRWRIEERVRGEIHRRLFPECDR